MKTASKPLPAPLATEQLERLTALLQPWEVLLDPVFRGDEHIPKKGPLLFVGNHTLYGVLDVPFLYAHLLRNHGIALRSLGDHLHFKLPVWRDLLTAFGAVDGTPTNAEALLVSGSSVLVFPGGGREVAKRKNEKYQLVWKERMGFIRLALRCGATIVPFAAVGVEDAYDILLDAEDLLVGTPGRIFDRFGMRREVVPPVAVGIGPTPLPRPERLYFQFMPAIPTTEWKGMDSDADVCRSLRDRARTSVERGLAELQALQAVDPDRPFRRRLMKMVRRTLWGAGQHKKVSR